MKDIRIIGYDISKNRVQIHYYDTGMTEPKILYFNDGLQGVSLIQGIRYDSRNGKWSLIEDDIIYNENDKIIYDIFNEGIDEREIEINGENVNTFNLLVEFVRMSLEKVYIDKITSLETYIVFTSDMNIKDPILLFKRISGNIGININNVFFQDYNESLFDYIWPTKKEYFARDVLFIEGSDNMVKGYKMIRGKVGKYDIVQMESRTINEITCDERGDRELLVFCRNLIGKSIVSTVVVIGTQLSAHWCKRTFPLLISNRYAFQTETIYSKGACYGGIRKLKIKIPEITFIDESKTLSSVSIKLKDKGKDIYYPIIDIGENWNEIDGKIYVILDDMGEVNFRIIDLRFQKQREETITLDGLIKRQNKSQKFEIRWFFTSKDNLHIIIKDVDFGEITKSENYYLERNIQLS